MDQLSDKEIDDKCVAASRSSSESEYERDSDCESDSDCEAPCCFKCSHCDMNLSYCECESDECPTCSDSED